MAVTESATLGQKAHDARELAQRLREEVGSLGEKLFGPRPEAADAPKRATQSVDDDVDEAVAILRSTLPMLVSLNQNVALGANRVGGAVYDETTETQPAVVGRGSRW